MEKLLITGGVPLVGELPVHGAKNSSLPLLAATLLVGGKTVLHNCPNPVSYTHLDVYKRQVYG